MPTLTAACGHSVTFVLEVFACRDFGNLGLGVQPRLDIDLQPAKCCCASALGEDA